MIVCKARMKMMTLMMMMIKIKRGERLIEQIPK